MEFGNIVNVKKNGAKGKKFPLFDHNEYKLGSATDCNIRITTLDSNDQHICSIRKNKNGEAYIEKTPNTLPVSLNGSELKLSKPLQTGDVIELAGKTFKWESTQPTKAVGKIVKKSGIPKIASRKSLNIRTNFRKSTRKSFGVLRSWEEKFEEETNRKLFTPDKSSMFVFVSDTPLKVSSPHKTEEFEVKSNQARKSNKRATKTPKFKSPEEIRSATTEDKSKVSIPEISSHIPKPKYFSTIKIERQRKKFFETPVKPMSASKGRGLNSPNKNLLKSEKKSKTPEKTEKTPKKTPGKSAKTPKSSGKAIATPAKSLKFPRQIIKFPIKSPRSLKKSAKSPDKSTKTPRKSIKTPNISTKTPRKSINTPNRSTKTSNKSTKTPNKSTKTPNKSSKTPNKSSKTPNQSVKTPNQLAKTPNKSTKTPNKSSKTPNQSAKTPNQLAKTPNQSAKTPNQSAKTPRNKSTKKVSKSASTKKIIKSPRTPLKSMNKTINTPNKSVRKTEEKKSPKKSKSLINTPELSVVLKDIIIDRKYTPSGKINVTNSPTKTLESEKKSATKSAKKFSPKIKIKLSTPKKWAHKSSPPKSPKRTPKTILTISNKTPTSTKKSDKKVPISDVKENITPPDSGSASPNSGVKTPENFMLKPLQTPESIKAVKSARKKDASLRKSLSTQEHSKKRKLSGITTDDKISKRMKLSTPLRNECIIIDGHVEFTPVSPRRNKAFSEPKRRTSRNVKSNAPSTIGRITMSHRSTPRAVWTVPRVSTDTPTMHLEEVLGECSPVSKNQDDAQNSFHDKDLSGIEKISNDSDINLSDSPKQSVGLSNHSFRSQKLNNSDVPLIDFSRPGPSKTSTVTKKKKSISLIDFTSPKESQKKTNRLSKSIQFSAQKNISVVSVDVHTPEPSKPSRSSKSAQRTPVQFRTVLSDKYENITPEQNTPTRATRLSPRKTPGGDNLEDVSMFVQYDEDSKRKSNVTNLDRSLNNSKNLSRISKKSLKTNNTPNNSVADMSKTIDIIQDPNTSLGKSNISRSRTLKLANSSQNESNVSKLSARKSEIENVTNSSDMSPLNISAGSTMPMSLEALNNSNTMNSFNSSAKSIRKSMIINETWEISENSVRSRKGNVTFNESIINASVQSTRSMNETFDISRTSNQRYDQLKKIRLQKSPRNDLSDVIGVKRMLELGKLPKNDLSDVKGVKRMFKTPRKQRSPRNDLRNIAGVKKIMATPRPAPSPVNDLSDVADVKKLFKTTSSPKNDLTDVRGVGRLFKKQQKSPRNDLRNIAGVKKIMTTPRPASSPVNDLTDVRGIGRLFRKQQKSPRNDLRNVAGVKKTMSTPRPVSSPVNDLSDVAGVRNLFKVTSSPKNNLEDVRGIKRLFGEASTSNTYLNVTDMNMLFDELKNDGAEDSFNIVEKLKNSPVRQYTRKAKSVSPVKENKAQKNRLSVIPSDKIPVISEWIEKQKKYAEKTKEKSNEVKVKAPSRITRRNQKETPQNTPNMAPTNTRSRRNKEIDELVHQEIENLYKPKEEVTKTKVTSSRQKGQKRKIENEVVEVVTKTRSRRGKTTEETVDSSTVAKRARKQNVAPEDTKQNVVERSSRGKRIRGANKNPPIEILEEINNVDGIELPETRHGKHVSFKSPVKKNQSTPISTRSLRSRLESNMDVINTKRSTTKKGKEIEPVDQNEIPTEEVPVSEGRSTRGKRAVKNQTEDLEDKNSRQKVKSKKESKVEDEEIKKEPVKPRSTRAKKVDVVETPKENKNLRSKTTEELTPVEKPKTRGRGKRIETETTETIAETTARSKTNTKEKSKSKKQNVTTDAPVRVTRARKAKS